MKEISDFALRIEMAKKLTFFLLATLSLNITGCFNLFDCEYNITASSVSPTGNVTAHLIDVGCGATSGFTTWVAVSEADEKLDFEGHRIAILDGKAEKISWTNNAKIEVVGEFDGVRVDNVKFNLLIHGGNLGGVEISLPQE